MTIYDIGLFTHRGVVRSRNEDAIFADGTIFHGNQRDVIAMQLTGAPHSVLVADGIGGQPEGDPRQDQRVEQAWPQHRQHRLVERARVAEIALQGLPGPGEVTLHQGLVDAIDGPQAGGVRAGHLGIARDHHVDRVARHQPDQQIDHEAHQGERDDGLNGPAGEVAAHAPSRFSKPAFTAGQSVSTIEK